MNLTIKRTMVSALVTSAMLMGTGCGSSATTRPAGAASGSTVTGAPAAPRIVVLGGTAPAPAPVPFPAGGRSMALAPRSALSGDDSSGDSGADGWTDHVRIQAAARPGHVNHRRAAPLHRPAHSGSRSQSAGGSSPTGGTSRNGDGILVNIQDLTIINDNSDRSDNRITDESTNVEASIDANGTRVTAAEPEAIAPAPAASPASDAVPRLEFKLVEEVWAKAKASKEAQAKVASARKEAAAESVELAPGEGDPGVGAAGDGLNAPVSGAATRDAVTMEGPTLPAPVERQFATLESPATESTTRDSLTVS